MNWFFSACVGLTFTFSISAMAAPGDLSVAAVSITDFSVGRQWTWEYRAADDSLFSTERYKVLSNDGQTVVIEMSTMLPGQTDFAAHHRLQVAVAKCLAAYSNPAQLKPWSIRMFFLDGATWREFEAPSTLAFEEKFNCHSRRDDSNEFKTEMKPSSAGELFQHLRWRRIAGSWFMNEGANRGVAFEKAFSHPGGRDSYTMRFVQAP